jgi:DNA-binding NtrC family response regulator
MLIVDDDPATRSILHRLLTLKGWDVRCAACPAEAVRELAWGPHCVIVDLFLGGEDGERVLEAIQAKRLQTCVVVVTGDDDHDRVNAVEAQFHPSAVFIKPTRPGALLQVCEQARPFYAAPSLPITAVPPAHSR